MMRAFVIVFFLLAGSQVGPVYSDQPNIVLILVDDLGKEWISCYGAQDIRTPHIDALAAGGMRFENAYSMPQCTPTRVTLLTGQYPFHHGWTNHFDVPRWGSGGHFDASLNASFANVAQAAGYVTAAAGKWQIDDFRVEPRAMQEAGFDEWCMWTGGETGNPASHHRYWDPYIHTNQGSRTYEKEFGPDIYCRFLVDFIRRNQSKPMLVYYPMVLTHGPLVHTPDEKQADNKMSKHKAMVRYTDKLVRRLVAVLEELDLRKKTIIIFTTDNGTSRGIVGSRVLAASKNGPKQVKGAKSRMNEAGTAMPFIVNGPGRVPAGVVTPALTDFTDILPTLTELCRGKIDDRFPVDGVSIAPLILGRATDSPRQWIVSVGGGPAAFRDNRVAPVEAFDDRVIRDQRWKLRVNKLRQATALYDLQNDPWEGHSLLPGRDPEAQEARKKLWAVIEKMPTRDNGPRYRPNPKQDWDKFDYVPNK